MREKGRKNNEKFYGNCFRNLAKLETLSETAAAERDENDPRKIRKGIDEMQKSIEELKADTAVCDSILSGSHKK